MAFERFTNNPYYEDPGVEILNEGLSRAAQNIGNMFAMISQKDMQRRKAADQFKFDIGNRKFENDDQIIREREFAVVNEMKDAIRRNDREAQRQAEAKLQGLQIDANASDIQFKTTEDMIKRVDKRATEDKYYDPREDEKMIRKATHGDDNEVNYYNRGNNLDTTQKQLFNNPRSFRINDYTADYVSKLGVKEKTDSTANPNAVNSRYSSSPFWDKTTGAPGVTDQHAVNYLKSREDGSVQRYIQEEVNEDLDREIKTMKSSGDAEWMKGKSDADIKNELIRDPSKNKVNSEDFGVRVRNKAKERLEEAADIKSKVDVEYKKDLSKTGGLFNNDSIAYSETFHNTNVGSPEQPVGDQGNTPLPKFRNAAPGGVLMINKGATVGKPITFESSSRNIFNINAGTSQQVRGSSTFNLTGYQVQAYDKSGKPFLFEANSEKEMVDKIKSMPNSAFANLEPTMSIAMNGFTINKAKMLGDVRTSTYDTNLELAAAKKSGDLMKQQQLEQRLMEMEEFRSQLNMDSDDFTDDDVMNAAARTGINQIRVDQLVKADRSDLDRINKITEGLNLNNRDKWSPAMRQVDDVYRQKYAEAAAAGFKDGKTKAPSKPKAQTISTEAFNTKWATLKSGESLVGPDGKTYTKK